MAITNWTGTAGDTDWDNDGNWSGSAPSTGDTVTFLASATTGPLLNVDKSAGNLNLVAMIIEEGVTYTMGAAGAPLTFTCDVLHHLGYNTLYFTSTGNTTTDAIVVLSNHPNALVLSATLQITWLAAFGGGITIAAGASTGMVNKLLVSPTTNFLLPKVTAAAAGTQMFNGVHISGGQVVDGRGYVALYQCGGIYNADGSVHTTSNIYGGRFNANDAGTYGTVLHLGGTVDLLNANAGQVKTITSYIPNRAGVELLYDPAVHTVTDVIGV